MATTGNSPTDLPEGPPGPEQRAQEFAAAAAGDIASRSDIDRRDFIGFVVGITGGLAVGGLAGIGIGHWLPGEEEVALVGAPTAGADTLVFYPRVRLASVSELRVGQPMSFEYPLEGQKGALVKLGKPAQFGLGPDADIVAFSTKCTHMGWPLDGTWNPDECVFGPCPGHFTTFDAAVGGQVVMGQATQRLPQIVLAIDGDSIYAEGVLGLIYGYRNNLADGARVEVTT